MRYKKPKVYNRTLKVVQTTTEAKRKQEKKVGRKEGKSEGGYIKKDVSK